MPSKFVLQQRRPALIPSDADLDEDDIQSIKLRTGDAVPIPPPDISKPTGSAGKSLNEQDSTRALNDNGKRKASTSAEDHHINNVTEWVLEEQKFFSLSENKSTRVILDKDTDMS